MLKAVVAATAAVTIAGSTIVYAQRDERQDGARRWHPSTEDMRAFQAARLAALRAGLTLTSDQEKHWPAFEQAMRDLQQFRLKRKTAIRDARREGRRRDADPVERMRRRADRLSERGAVLKRLAEAAEPLYRSLDDAQKRRFAILSRKEGLRGWHRRGRDDDDDEREGRRRHRRTDAPAGDVAPVETAPAKAAPQFERILMRKEFGGEPHGHLFTHKTVDGDAFAHTVVSQTVDGVMVGRVFGTRTVNGDLMIGETAAFTGRPVFSAPGTYRRKITIGEPPLFGRKAVTDI